MTIKPLDFATAFAAWHAVTSGGRVRMSEAREIGDVLLYRLAGDGWPESIQVARQDLDLACDPRTYRQAAAILAATGIWRYDTVPGGPSTWRCDYAALLRFVDSGGKVETTGFSDTSR